MLLAVALVLSLAGGGTAYWVLRDDGGASTASGPAGVQTTATATADPSADPTEEPTAEPTEEPRRFRDWLPVRERIRVGKRPYVSPCQLLTRDDLTAVHDFPETAEMDELMMERSLPVQGVVDTGQYTACTMDPFALYMEQHGSADANLFYASRTEGDELTPRKLRVFEQAAAASGEPELIEFVAELAAGPRVVEKWRNDYTGKAQRADERGVFLPVGTDAYSIELLRGTIRYTLMFDTDRKAKVDLADDLEVIAERLDTMRRLFEIILERVDDPRLPQRHLPTILGEEDHNGSTPVLDACSVFDSEAFRRIAGEPDNQPAWHTVPAFGVDVVEEELLDSADEQAYAETGCSRSRWTLDDNLDVSVYMYLTLEMPPSVAAAKERLRSGYLNRDSTRLRTSADWAARVVYGAKGGEDVVAFREGPYIGTLYLLRTGYRDGDLDRSWDQEGSQADYERAIDVFVDALRRDLRIARR